MLGIIIGVGAVITMIAIGSGAAMKMDQFIAGVGSNLLMIFPGAAQTGGSRQAAGSAATLTLADAAREYAGPFSHMWKTLPKAMRIDMLKHNIKVTNIAPGMVETEFSLVRFKGDADKAQFPYVGLVPLFGEDIADAILYAVTRPEHVCINDMEITPMAQANAFYVFRK